MFELLMIIIRGLWKLGFGGTLGSIKDGLVGFVSCGVGGSWGMGGLRGLWIGLGPWEYTWCII